MLWSKKKLRVLLERSVFFDPEFIRSHTKIMRRKNAAEVYLDHWREMSNPSEFFDNDFYLTAYADVAASRFPPLVHYLLYGWKEGRSPSGKFDRNTFLTSHRALRHDRIDAAETCILIYGTFEWQKKGLRTGNIGELKLSKHYEVDDSTREESIAAPHVNLSPRFNISVVIPTYNRAALIKETSEHILNLVGDNDVELIVVDDGSQDSTADVLSLLQLQTGKLRYERIPNSGPGPARNVGAALSRGSVIVFLGDDTRPTSSDFFKAHYLTHVANPSKGHMGLGKVVWPDDRTWMPNFVMSLIQGDGQQQFGYKFMKPWMSYSPWLFYTANASVKSDIVDDWTTGGFSNQFTLYGFEDGEFAYRMSKMHENFGVYYNPTAVVEHFHKYDVAGFIKRQVSCGFMMQRLFQIHPELKPVILDGKLNSILEDQRYDEVASSSLSSHYIAAIQGIKAWAVILDERHGLGSKNWHGDFLNAVFQISFLEGYLSLQDVKPPAQCAAYQHILNDFMQRITRAIQYEALGDLPGFEIM